MATFQDVRAQAQQGNVGAIATLINHSFSRQGIRVQAKVVQRTLLVKLTSSTPLEAQPTVTRIYHGLKSLKPEGIQRLQVIAQVNDNDTPLWQKSVNLGVAVEPQSEPPPPLPVPPPPPIPVAAASASPTSRSGQASPPRSTSRVLVGGRQPSGQWLPLWMEWIIANGLLTILLVLVTPRQVRVEQALMLGVLAALPSAYAQTCILTRRLPRAWNWGAFTLAGGVPMFGWIIQIFGHWWVLRRTADASRWLVAHLVYTVVMFIANAIVLGTAVYLLFDGDGRIFLLLVMGLSLTAVTAWALETILAQVPERLPAPEPAPMPYLQAALQRPFAPVLPTTARLQPVPNAITAFTAPPAVAIATTAFTAPPPPTTAVFADPPSPSSQGTAGTVPDGNISGNLPQQQAGSRPSRSKGYKTPNYQFKKQLNGFWWRWVMAGLKSILRPLLLVMLLIFVFHGLGGPGVLLTEADVIIFNWLIGGLFVLLSCLLLGDAQAKILQPFLGGWANLWRWTTFLGVLFALVLTFIFPVAGPQILQMPGWFFGSWLDFTTLRFVVAFVRMVFVPLGGFILSLLQFWPLCAAQQTRSRAWIWLLLNTVLFVPLVPLSWFELGGFWAIGLRIGFVLLYLPLSGLVMHYLVLRKG